MKANEILNKIKSIVGVELAEESVKLAEMKLENGTILVAESFESGQAVFIKTEEEQIALPVGEYALEDGKMLKVEEEGLISEIMDAKAEVEEEVVEEEMQEETKEEVQFVSADEFKSTIEELKAMIEELKSKEEMSEETQEEIKEETQEEIKEETTELSKKEKIEEVTELTAETKEEKAEPIKHNPETTQKTNKVLFGQKRTETIRDRVFSKIANN